MRISWKTWSQLPRVYQFLSWALCTTELSATWSCLMEILFKRSAHSAEPKLEVWRFCGLGVLFGLCHCWPWHYFLKEWFAAKLPFGTVLMKKAVCAYILGLIFKNSKANNSQQKQPKSTQNGIGGYPKSAKNRPKMGRNAPNHPTWLPDGSQDPFTQKVP